MERALIDLVGVGKAFLRDFDKLGITEVDQLKGRDPQKLYDQLKKLNGGGYLDMCVLDVFSCAVAQAENPNLPKEQCDWWYYSKKRKAQKK